MLKKTSIFLKKTLKIITQKRLWDYDDIALFYLCVGAYRMPMKLSEIKTSFTNH